MANRTFTPRAVSASVEFPQFVLGLRDRHAVARDHDHIASAAQDQRGVLRGGRVHGLGRSLRRRSHLRLPERAKQNVGEGAVHGIAHDHRKDKARRGVERAGDDQQAIAQRETHGRAGCSGVGIQQRNDGGHVASADGHDQQHSEQERQTRVDGKDPRRRRSRRSSISRAQRQRQTAPG